MGIIEKLMDWIEKIFVHSKKTHIGGWKKLHPNEVPSWVERASHKFHKKHPVRNHNLRKDFRGKYYLYRVYYKKAAHGRVEEEYWRKKK